MSKTTKNTTVSMPDDEDEFWQTWTSPEEDCRAFTSASWDGGYRWFRSPNVVCLERYRRRRKDSAQHCDGDDMSDPAV
jgi:hypothetical protein